MRTADALARLDQHQVQILAHVERALTLLTLPAAEAQMGLAQARWQLVRMLQAYQIFKHNEIFDPAMRSGTPIHKEAAAAMKADCIAVGEEFRSYVQHWSSASITNSWDAYQPAMRQMAERLRAHILNERRSIEALLAQADRTRRLSG